MIHGKNIHTTVQENNICSQSGKSRDVVITRILIIFKCLLGFILRIIVVYYLYSIFI